MKLRSKVLGTCALSLCITATVSSSCFAYTLQSKSEGYYKRNIDISLSQITNKDDLNQIKSAIQSWNNVLTYRQIVVDNNSPNTIQYFPTANGTGHYENFDGDNRKSNKCTKFYILIDPGLKSSGVLLQSVVAHELGHALGLDHTSDHATLMCVDRDRKKVVSPTTDDIKGANSIITNLVETKVVDVYADNIQECKYDKKGKLVSTTYSWGNSVNHPTYEYSVTTKDGTWKGTLDKYDSKVMSTVRKTNSDGSYSISTTFRGYFRGTVTLNK